MKYSRSIKSLAYSIFAMLAMSQPARADCVADYGAGICSGHYSSVAFNFARFTWTSNGYAACVSDIRTMIPNIPCNVTNDENAIPDPLQPASGNNLTIPLPNPFPNPGTASPSTVQLTATYNGYQNGSMNQTCSWDPTGVYSIPVLSQAECQVKCNNVHPYAAACKLVDVTLLYQSCSGTYNQESAACNVNYLITNGTTSPRTITGATSATDCMNKASDVWTGGPANVYPFSGSCKITDVTPTVTSCAFTYNRQSPGSCSGNYTLSNGTSYSRTITGLPTAGSSPGILAVCTANAASWTSPKGVAYSIASCTTTDVTPQTTTASSTGTSTGNTTTPAYNSCTGTYNQTTQLCTQQYYNNGALSGSAVTRTASSMATCAPGGNNLTCAITDVTPAISMATACTGSFNTTSGQATVTYTTNGNVNHANLVNVTSGSVLMSKLQSSYSNVNFSACTFTDATPALPYQVQSCSGHYRPAPNNCELTYIVGRTAGENITLNRTVANVMHLKDCRDLSTAAFTDTTYGALTAASCSVN
jgi:hypothetical protein